MRRLTVALALVLVLAGIARVRGDEAPAPPPTTTVPAPPTQSTTLEGTVPDLEGRWLLVATSALAQSSKRTLVSVFDNRRTDG